MFDMLLDWPASGRDCFEFRIGLEGEAAAAAARDRTREDLDMLAEIVSRLEHLDTTTDPGLEADFAFHLGVARASHNHYYVSALQSLRATIFEGMLLARTSSGLRTAEKIAAINEQHRLVYTAIVVGDAEAARWAMRSHLTRCRNSTSHWDAPSLAT